MKGDRNSFYTKRKWLTFIVLIIIAMNTVAVSQNVNKGQRQFEKDRLFSDTLTGGRDYQTKLDKSNQAYDSIYRSKSWFVRTLASLLVTSPVNANDASEVIPELGVGRHYYARFAGKRIASINLLQANVFERDSSEQTDGFAKFIDKLHVRTNERQIRQNILFKVGQKVDPYTMSINEELLRSLPFVATAYMVLLDSPDNPDAVSVNIFVRDNWTISGDFAWFWAHYISAFDRNFLGTGNELLLRYYFPVGSQANGAEIQYNINNLWGTFADVSLQAGVGYTNNKLKIQASRRFILPSDHIWGFVAGYEQENVGITSFDTTMLVNRLDLAAWYGYSWCLDRDQGTTLYLTAGVDNAKFNKRPHVWNNINPFYYNRLRTLAAFGVSRQNFFQGNMIYGYGRTEDVPFGYKFEAVGGLEWSEFFGRRYYLGGTFAWGDLIGSSYLNTRVSIGSFINQQGYFEQGVINASINYFTPLFKMGKSYVRQFFYSTATWGLNRFWGEREQITYNSIARVRGMGSAMQNFGSNRFTFGGETVFFSPIFLYHFRFAFYLWGDIGFLGYNTNVFKGDIASAVGIGVRIKNERLIFNNVQLRLGFSLRRPDHMNFEMFSISNEYELRLDTFRPEVPRIVNYE